MTVISGFPSRNYYMSLEPIRGLLVHVLKCKLIETQEDHEIWQTPDGKGFILPRRSNNLTAHGNEIIHRHVAANLLKHLGRLLDHPTLRHAARADAERKTKPDAVDVIVQRLEQQFTRLPKSDDC